MKNFVFISPHFPDCFWKFCLALKNRGFCVLGIGDCPYDRLQGELKYALTEYYCCYDMENYENEKRAVAYFENIAEAALWLDEKEKFYRKNKIPFAIYLDTGLRENEGYLWDD